MMVVIFVGSAMIAAFILVWLMVSALEVFLDTVSSWNMFAIIKRVCLPFTPKTPIQKEIEEKRKEIDQLKKQKADMAELERLTKEEEELFREIKEDK